MLQTLKAAKGRLSTLALTPVAMASAYIATTKAAMADNADIRGALEINQEALEAVAESTFTEDGVESAAQATTNSLLFFAGAAGIAMVMWGIWKLYKISNEGEQSRDSAGLAIGMIVVGGMMTVAAIVTAIFPNLFVGEAA